MTEAVPGRAMVFLRRAFLLAGMLAIIAGILGMHIMTGSHSMTAPAAGPAMELAQDAQTSARTTPGPVGTAAEGTPAAQGTASMSVRSCATAHECTDMSAMGAACIPSPGNPPPAVPSPGVTPFAAAVSAPLPTGFATHPYLPGSPSPGELCISRT